MEWRQTERASNREWEKRYTSSMFNTSFEMQWNEEEEKKIPNTNKHTLACLLNVQPKMNKHI